MNKEITAEKNKIVLITPIICVIIPSILMNVLNLDVNTKYLYATFLGWLAIALLIEFIIQVLRLLTTKLYFDDKKIYGKTGIVNIKSLESPLNKINDIFIIKNIFGLVFNYSTIIVSTSSSNYKFRYIKNAELFRKELIKYIENYNHFKQ